MAKGRASDVVGKLKTLMGVFADARIDFEALAGEYALRKAAGEYNTWPDGFEDYPQATLEAGIAAMTDGIGGMTTEQKAAVSLAR